MDEIINSRCICGEGLPFIRKEVVMIEPCQHLLHLECSGKKYCSMCCIKITKIRRLKDKNKKKLWKYNDILSMTNCEVIPYINGLNNTINFFKLFRILGNLTNTNDNNKGIERGLKISERILKMCNIKINIINKHNIPDNSAINIVNHSNYLDFLIMFYVYKCGFLASAFVKNNWLGEKLLKVVPCLVIERGKSENTVEKIKKYVDDNKSITIFPEGMISNFRTIMRFRTGSFRAERPISPAVITYSPFIHSYKPLEMLEASTSGKKIEANIEILPPVYPPFDDTKIENIRYTMAKKGKLFVSRVSNHDIKE